MKFSQYRSASCVRRFLTWSACVGFAAVLSGGCLFHKPMELDLTGYTQGRMTLSMLGDTVDSTETYGTVQGHGVYARYFEHPEVADRAVSIAIKIGGRDIELLLPKPK